MDDFAFLPWSSSPTNSPPPSPSKSSSSSEEEGLDGDPLSFALTTAGDLDAAGSQGWDFRTAIDILKRTERERMGVEGLVKAKRKEIKERERGGGEADDEEADIDAEQEEDEVEDEEDSDSDSEEEGSDGDSNGESESKSDSSSEGGEEDSDSDSDSDSPDMDHRGLTEDNVRQTDTGANGPDSDSNPDSDSDSAAEALASSKFYSSSATASSLPDFTTFAELNLSRPLLRGLAAVNYVSPTPVQALTIPPALKGLDVCSSAVTGSGKTAAFLLPCMERSLRAGGRSVKCIVLTPTRELAAQCLSMFLSIARYTNLTSCLCVGGSKNVREQAAELGRRPDFVVATPGRLNDHLTNARGFEVDDLAMLVLDEVSKRGWLWSGRHH